MRTRVASFEDASEVRSVRDIGFATVRDTYTPNHGAAPAALNASGCRSDILADIDGFTAGVVSAAIEGNTLRITGLAVAPEFRRLGVARALIESAERVAVNARCDNVRLFTIRETGNVSLFARLGFHFVGEAMADWCSSTRFDTLHEVQMEKICG
ncbi:GNAT family N-acetyltransferase [Neorhodopirellula lusitana]|uniref:GNAT family N-acetyltransferase n=1 Tax=Neorhodopirellula lusitana TaxID=445327 RepID=UPI003850BE9E